jgi:hypothetical protein
MSQPFTNPAARLKWGVAGKLHLIVILAAVFVSLFLRGPMFADGNPPATARNIQIFLGLYCLALGCLMIRSRFPARFAGALMAVEGLGYLFASLALFLAPSLAARVFPYMVPMALAEISLYVWLLVAGIQVQRLNMKTRNVESRRDAQWGEDARLTTGTLVDYSRTVVN